MSENEQEDGKNLFVVAPQLLVEDVVATAEDYRDTLGFDIGPVARRSEDEPAFFCMVTRDGFFIQLRRASEGHGQSNRAYDKEACDVYFFVKDVGALHQEFVDRGAKIVSGPEDTFYQMREINVEDSNGYVIGFGQPIHEHH